MFYILSIVLCCMVLSCNAYLRCNNPPRKREEGATVNKWPDNTVPYEITDVFSPTQKQLIRTSLQEVTEKTGNCVKFHEKTDSDTNWVRVISADGCWSNIGKIYDPGYQNLSLAVDGCMFKQTVIHEFLHALGFVHEQVRPDRDTYVKVLWENVQLDQRHNYQIDNRGTLQSSGLPYDFNSVMHYVYDGFSINCLAVLEPVGSNLKPWRYTMGTATDMTESDIFKIKKMFCPS